MAGYSGTPLVKKLGIRGGQRARFIDPPEGYERAIGRLPDDVTVLTSTRGTIDFIHVFADRAASLRRRLPGAVRALARDGALWISWPKKASGVETDVTEHLVRSSGLEAGLVDVKICAVDETWSALKFVYRRADR